VPADLAAELRGCSEIAVVARQPLHGRADLLPVELPWWFAGDVPSAAPVAGARRALEVADARPPDPSLARLVSGPRSIPFDATLTGADATPKRVLAELADATYAELHVHGLATANNADAAYLALSPDAEGAFALRADAVRATRLRRAPLVVLAACRASTTAPYLRQRWSLPDAFLAAGASGVIAVDVPLSDASARRVFDELHRRVDAGEPVARAVAAIRASAGADVAWARRLMVFR
jgi:cellulose synthase operon protein C